MDVVGDVEAELGRPVATKKKDLLEEGTNLLSFGFSVHSIKDNQIIWYNVYGFNVLDLQFSSEDEFDEVPFGVDDAFETTELKPLEPVEVRPEELPADDDSQQVAEAMIQLGNAGSYTLGEPPIHPNGKRFI